MTAQSAASSGSPAQHSKYLPFFSFISTLLDSFKFSFTSLPLPRVRLLLLKKPGKEFKIVLSLFQCKTYTFYFFSTFHIHTCPRNLAHLRIPFQKIPPFFPEPLHLRLKSASRQKPFPRLVRAVPLPKKPKIAKTQQALYLRPSHPKLPLSLPRPRLELSSVPPPSHLPPLHSPYHLLLCCSVPSHFPLIPVHLPVHMYLKIAVLSLLQICSSSGGGTGSAP